MVRVTWDVLGSKTYHTGVDRGLLFINRDRAVPWNGLTNVTIAPSNPTSESYYIDGEKFNSYRSREELSATVSAFTYPDEFDWFQGHRRNNGVGYYAQPRNERFHLSWRTFVGGDKNTSRYKIHILYNCTASVSPRSYQTITNTPNIESFQWEIECIPENVATLKRTAYVVLDSKFVSKTAMVDLEDILYGTPTQNPKLPSGILIDALATGKAPLDITKKIDGMNPVVLDASGGLTGSKNVGLYNIANNSDLITSSTGLHRLV